MGILLQGETGLEAETGSPFSGVIRLAEAHFPGVEVVIDVTPERAILRFEAERSGFRVVVKEIVAGDERKYAYYVLCDGEPVAGFDNSHDPRAIRLKYGKISDAVAYELIPHQHRGEKRVIELTGEMQFEDFVLWFETNLRGKECP